MVSANRFDQPRLGSEAVGRQQHLMLFDLDYRGHHAGYIQHLVQYWKNAQLPGQLSVLVSRRFIQSHPDVVALESEVHRVRFISITPEEQDTLFDSAELGDSFKGRIQRAFQEWDILQRYTRRLGITHCMLMYLDTALLRLAFARRWSCPFSCIYFRPVFHYADFEGYAPAGRERVWQWRDRVCLNGLLQSKALDTLFCLDPFAVERLNQMDRQKRAAYLQDPVQIYPASATELEALRQRLGIQTGRKVCLLFGVLDPRKGTHEVLEAIANLPPELCQQLCFLLVGPANADETAYLADQSRQLCARLPVQIICRHDFVPDRAVQGYFQISDLILAPYQRHIGMSAILVRAATAQKPVLASDFGLMGQIAHRYGLGRVVDAAVPTEIAKGIDQFLQDGLGQSWDLESMQRFAEQNRAETFAHRVFQALMAKSPA